MPLALAPLPSPAVPPLSAGPALAANGADFTPKNQTGRQINEVYVSAHSNKRWGKDVMGEDTLGAGQYIKITFPGKNSACMFKIMAKYCDDDMKYKWSNIGLCKYPAITLYIDKRNRVTRAVGE